MLKLLSRNKLIGIFLLLFLILILAISINLYIQKYVSIRFPTINPRKETFIDCLFQHRHLDGPVYVNMSIMDFKYVENNLLHVKKLKINKGGVHTSDKCPSEKKTALIIPFRQREQQLIHFLNHMHPILVRQLINYRIFVIEQMGNSTFNRALLFNIGFKIANKYDRFSCFIFSDVDLLPENDQNTYDCPFSPMHMSAAVDKFDYKLPYKSIFGGVNAFEKDHFTSINGFSNTFWGWGGEDDNLCNRVVSKGYIIHRISMDIARYKMNKVNHTTNYYTLKSKNKTKNIIRKNFRFDGLNSLSGYEIIAELDKTLYTHISVKVDDGQVKF